MPRISNPSARPFLRPLGMAAWLLLVPALAWIPAGCSGSKADPTTPATTAKPTDTPTSTPVLTYPFSKAYGTQSGTQGSGGDFVEAMGIAVAKKGTEYIAVSDPGFGNIQVFDESGVYLYEIDGTNSGATFTAPSQPYGMAFDDKDNLYVADAGTHEVDVYALTGTGGTWSGYYVGELNGAASITGPWDVKFDNQGNLVVADYNSGYTYNVDFNTDDVLASTLGSGDGGGLSPAGVAVDSQGNIYVSDQANNYVVCYGPNYLFQYAFNGNSPYNELWPTGLGVPAGLAVDSEGDLIVSDSGNGQVVRTDLYGLYNENIGATGAVTIGVPEYVDLNSSGDLYVVDASQQEFYYFVK